MKSVDFYIKYDPHRMKNSSGDGDATVVLDALEIVECNGEFLSPILVEDEVAPTPHDVTDIEVAD